MISLLSPEVKEVVTGQVEIRQIFTIGKTVKIAGCYVTEVRLTETILQQFTAMEKKYSKALLTSLNASKMMSKKSLKVLNAVFRLLSLMILKKEILLNL